MKQLDGALRTLHERVVDLALCEHRAHRYRAVGQTLGGGHKVGRYFEFLGRERLADATESGDHLVEYQQDIVLGANFTQALQVSEGG